MKEIDDTRNQQIDNIKNSRIPPFHVNEDKDLERVRDILLELGDCQNSVPRHCYKPGNERCDEETHLLSFLREERRRLLNDPRIKDLLKSAKESEALLCKVTPFGFLEGRKELYDEYKETVQFAQRAWNSFESLLKENE